MAGMIGYNPYSDASGAMGGGGDILGSTILRGALMRQAQAQQQQQLMMELMRMKMEQEQGQQTQKYREGELRLGQGRLDIEKKKQEGADEELGMRKKFGASMRMQGVPQPPGGMGPLSPEEQQQGDQQEGAAFLSNEPKNALDTILRMQAMRQVPMDKNPVVAQELLTGMGLHNIPRGNVAVPPGGGAPVAEGQPFPTPGAQVSPNALSTLMSSILRNASSTDQAQKDPLYNELQGAFLQALRQRFGTNTPAMTNSSSSVTNAPKIVIQGGNKFQLNPDGSHSYLGPAN